MVPFAKIEHNLYTGHPTVLGVCQAHLEQIPGALRHIELQYFELTIKLFYCALFTSL